MAGDEQQSSRERWAEWEKRTGYEREKGQGRQLSPAERSGRIGPALGVQEIGNWASRKTRLPEGTQAGLPWGRATTPGMRSVEQVHDRLKEIDKVLSKSPDDYRPEHGQGIRGPELHQRALAEAFGGKERVSVRGEVVEFKGDFAFKQLDGETVRRVSDMLWHPNDDGFKTRVIDDMKTFANFETKNVPLDKYRDGNNQFALDLISGAMVDTQERLGEIRTSVRSSQMPDMSAGDHIRAGGEARDTPYFVETDPKHGEVTYMPLNGAARVLMASSRIVGIDAAKATVFKESDIKDAHKRLSAEVEIEHRERIREQTERAEREHRERVEREAKLAEERAARALDPKKNLKGPIELKPATPDHFKRMEEDSGYKLDPDRAEVLAEKMNKLFDGNAPTAEGLAHIFSGDKDGQRFKFEAMSPGEASMYVSGKIVDENGVAYGDVSRDFSKNADGTLHVHHSFFEIGESKQGGGIGDAVMRKSFEAYQQMNVKDVSVSAHWIGRYMWARVGFDWKDNDQRDEHAESFASWASDRMVKKDGSRVTRADAIEVFQNFDHAWELADFNTEEWTWKRSQPKDPNGKPMHPGKAFLLDDDYSSQGWRGKFVVNDPSHPTFKRAKSKIGMRDLADEPAVPKPPPKPLAPERRRREGRPRGTPGPKRPLEK